MSYDPEYYQNNKDRFKKNFERYKRTPQYKENLKWNKLKYKYGLTKEQYTEMKIKQQNLCAICECEKPLVVDHCHKQNKVRGLLCDACNRGLGCFRDNSHNLISATNYLIKR